MGKTPKKAAPGGDERNLYVRRIKATTAPSKTSESNLHERQRESENSNRPSLSGIHKKVTSSKRIKGLRCKLHNTANLSSSQGTKALTKSLDSTVKEDKVQNTFQHLPLMKQKMQPQSEEIETTINIAVEKDEKEKNVSQVANKNEEVTIKDGSANHTIDEQDSTSPIHTEKSTVEGVEEDKPADNENNLHDKENNLKGNIDDNDTELEEQEQDEVQFKLQIESSPVKLQEAISNDGQINEEKEMEQLPPIQEINDDTKENKNSQIDVETGTETCSVVIIESVTSDVLEVSEPAKLQNIQKETESSQPSVKSDISGITYDASVTLKDVEIRLNDCLKENTKHTDVNDIDDVTSQILSSESFGKTLRNISGRRSINRLRYTPYEYRFIPNDSRYTNISSLSLPQEKTTNIKILRYSTGLSETMPTNGSSVERKRKLDSPEIFVTKKPKTRQGNLLNTSIDLLRGLRKPIQISTPNVGYKVQSDKLNISEINDDNDKLVTMNDDEGTRKWCVIM